MIIIIKCLNGMTNSGMIQYGSCVKIMNNNIKKKTLIIYVIGIHYIIIINKSSHFINKTTYNH